MCLPILQDYAKKVMKDADSVLREVDKANQRRVLALALSHAFLPPSSSFPYFCSLCTYTTQVTGLLLDERFADYPRLAESMKRDVAKVQQLKLEQAEDFVARLLEAETNWVSYFRWRGLG